MAGPADFAKIAVHPISIEAAKERYAAMGEAALAGEHGWAGFATEDAVAGAGGMTHSTDRRWDLELPGPGRGAELMPLRIEVKTRVATEGWDHPARFDWVVIPTHDGREPVKDEADIVLFVWYSVEAEAHAWVLGYCRGVNEFRRRAVFYREGEPLPRGGWAGTGGAYCMDVTNLRPVPRGMFKEID